MIGVFDSGIGGLTVLRELLQLIPQESFLYLGDTARLPYGTKSPETIRKYSEQIMDYLAAQKVSAIVIACNSASSQVSETEWKGIPVFTVISPGAEAAILASQSKKIGILGTRATIHSRAYANALKSFSSEVEVFSQACPLFVPLAEEGWVEDPITNLITYRYLQPLIQSGIDTLILGCTHYPLLWPAIQKVAGHSIQLIDPGKAVAQKLKLKIDQGSLKIPPSDSASITLLSTDMASSLKTWATQIIAPHQVHRFDHVDL